MATGSYTIKQESEITTYWHIEKREIKYNSVFETVVLVSQANTTNCF
jgi:hypothetical protein